MPKPDFGKKGMDQINENLKKLNEGLDDKIKNAVTNVLIEKEEKEKIERAKKMEDALKVAKNIKEGKEGKDGKEGDNNEIDCPNCHKGHVHAMKTDKFGLKYKCEGEGCGKDFVLVNKDSDYRCKTCKMPIKRPDEALVQELTCPFCSGKNAEKYSWNNYWKK